jgi:hypothetical protein
MKNYLWWFGLVAVFHSGLAQAQTAAHEHASPPAKEAVKPVEPRAAPVRPGAYRSPFETYRPFKADEPLQDWRAANERVREAGGHVGLMKDAGRKK